MISDKLVIGLAGMPGAGKSTVVNVAKEGGYKVVVMGDVVREEVEKRRMKPTPKNLGKIMLELRRIEGEAVIAKRCIPKIEKVMEQKVVIDGVRSLSEVEEFKKHLHRFSLIAVHASPETRFRRLYRRNRSDDPKNWEIFHERDMRELRVGLSNALAMAEYIIVNEGGLEVVKDKIREVLRKVEEKWMK
ncbi:MAG: AAA family ATPase [Candidatus Bathyarchaeota archaeon]|nr:AAA family ATPase [Candidatus Bathyarchaeota archaeon]MDH5745716.1 AAA family ATPase [Candidatus Bathyarchaeota archaeon]